MINTKQWKIHSPKRINSPLLVTLLLCCCLAVTNTAIAKPPPGTKLAKEQILRKGNAAEPQSLDPHKTEGVPSSNILRDLFEGLVGEAPNGDLIPGAAERWELSDDGLTYTFHIRQNAKWSNGDPVTAHDFEYGFKRVVNPKTLSDYALTLASIVNAAEIIQGDKPTDELGVKALSNTELEIKLVGPTPYFLGLLTHSTTYAVHKPSVEKYGDRYARPGNLVSNGAYKLDDWVVNKYVKLVRNKQYWDDQNTTIEEVYYYPTEDMNAAIRQYRAGEVDFTYNQIAATQMPWIKQNLADELQITPYLGVYYYSLNFTREPFKDNPKLRQALSMALDREVIAEKVMQGDFIPAYGFVPKGTANYETWEYPWKDLPMAERIKQAQKLYAEAGYSKSNPLKVEFRYNTQENHKRIGLAVAAMWKQALGVEMSLLNQEWKVFLEVRKQKKETQVARDAWIGDYNDAYSFLELHGSKHELNNSGYVSAKYDDLLAQSRVEFDVDKRAQILRQAEQVALEDYAVIPIYYYVSPRLVKPYVAGYDHNIMDHHYTKNFYILEH